MEMTGEQRDEIDLSEGCFHWGSVSFIHPSGHLTFLILACVSNVWDQIVVGFKDFCINKIVFSDTDHMSQPGHNKTMWLHRREEGLGWWLWIAEPLILSLINTLLVQSVFQSRSLLSLSPVFCYWSKNILRKNACAQSTAAITKVVLLTQLYHLLDMQQEQQKR